MAYRRSKSRSYRPRRRSRRNFRKRNFARMRAPLGNRLMTKVKYVDRTIEINPGAVLMGTHFFSASGITDPDVTGSGHQPRGFDQLMAMYEHYTVIGSKITITFQPTASSSSNQNAVVGIALKNSAVAPGDANEYLEGRNTVYKFISNTTNSGIQPVRLSMTYSPKKFLSNSAPLSDPYLKGNASANPIEESYFVAFADNVDNSTDLNAIQAHVHLEYMVVFHEPLQPGQS